MSLFGQMNSCSPDSTLTTPPASPREEVDVAFPPSPPGQLVRLAQVPIKAESLSPEPLDFLDTPLVFRRTGTLPADDRRGPVKLVLNGDLQDMADLSEW